MPSPGWFFSTVAQVTVTIIAFIISLIAVLQQLRYDRKKRRINDFKKQLVDFNNKYKQSSNEIMTLLKNFYDGSVPKVVLEPSKTSSTTIDSKIENCVDKYPISNSVWLHTYNIHNILKSIDSNDDVDRGELPEKEKINEINKSLDFQLGKISKGENTMSDEIKTFQESEELSITKDIFEKENSGHNQLKNWFNRYFSPNDNKHDQSGKDILSLVNYFEEMNDDFEELQNSYHAAKSLSNNNFSQSFKYIVTILIVGVLIPILSMLTVPDRFAILSGIFLTIYQIIIISATAILVYKLLKNVNEYLLPEY